MSQPIDRPRSAALELLRAVREDDAYANLVLPQILHGYGLSGRDAGFATELGYGTLRWKGWYDAILASCVTRPWSKVEPGLQDILRLGAHQVLAMRCPITLPSTRHATSPANWARGRVLTLGPDS